MKFLKEKDLFAPLKAHFKGMGYKVYAEVPCFYRGVDFVAVNGDDHIAVEMKMSFNRKVVQQAHDNILSFGKSYVAFPVKKPILFHNDDVYWKMRESRRVLYDRCEERGIGILEVMPGGTIFEALEAKYQKPYRVFDFSQFEESDEDEAGLPCQKGVSMGYYELEGIKEYLKTHPRAKWRELWENVQNHYSSPSSMASSMRSWRGFFLEDYRQTLLPVEEKVEQKILL